MLVFWVLNGYSLVLDNILVSQKYGWGSNVANADVVKLLDIKIPKEKQYNDKIYSSYMLQQSIAKNIEEKLKNTNDKLKLVKTMKKLNKMKIDNTLDRIFINSLNESIFIDDCEIHINDITYDKTLTLEDIANKLNAGGTPPRNVVEYWDFLNTGENPWLDIDSKEFSTLKISNFRESITRDGINNSSTWKVPANSIMITIGGSLGFVANNNFDTYTNQNILSIVPKDEYYSRYLVYFLEYFYSTKVRNNNNGYSNLSKKTEEKRIVFIPKKLGSIESFDIQIAIANFLDKKYTNYNHIKKQLNELNNILIGVKGKIWNF